MEGSDFHAPFGQLIFTLVCQLLGMFTRDDDAVNVTPTTTMTTTSPAHMGEATDVVWVLLT